VVIVGLTLILRESIRRAASAAAVGGPARTT
jgi:hypothetical protein